MEKRKLLAARAYCLLFCNITLTVSADKQREESLLLQVRNDGGEIHFAFVDLSTGETKTFDNPSTGEYAVSLKRSSKVKLLITANRAIGSYRIEKRTSVD